MLWIDWTIPSMSGGEVNLSGKLCVGTACLSRSKSSLSGLTTLALYDDTELELGGLYLPPLVKSTERELPDNLRVTGRSTSAAGTTNFCLPSRESNILGGAGLRGLYSLGGLSWWGAASRWNEGATSSFPDDGVKSFTSRVRDGVVPLHFISSFARIL